jgi:hypothetical protein
MLSYLADLILLAVICSIPYLVSLCNPTQPFEKAPVRICPVYPRNAFERCFDGG